MVTSDSSSRSETFFTAKKARDARCVHKDALTLSLFRRLRITDPAAFTAVLMPSLHGPEVDWLLERGVPLRNLFAIERQASTHRELARRRIPTTPVPMRAQDALDHVPHDRVDLCYLDFFGQPNHDHLTVLRKLFRLHLHRGSRLWVTFGVNRGVTFSCHLNRKLRIDHAGEAYVRAAHALVDRAPRILGIRNHVYKSSDMEHPANFVLTEVRL